MGKDLGICGVSGSVGMGVFQDSIRLHLEQRMGVSDRVDQDQAVSLYKWRVVNDSTSLMAGVTQGQRR